MKKRRYVTGVMFGGVLTVLLLMAVVMAVMAQNSARREGDFSAMVHTLLENDQLVMFVLNAPLSTGETILTTDEAIVQVGDDYVCFGETWNDGVRQRCTPFANIASVTFVESP